MGNNVPCMHVQDLPHPTVERQIASRNFPPGTPKRRCAAISTVFSLCCGKEGTGSCETYCADVMRWRIKANSARSFHGPLMQQRQRRCRTPETDGQRPGID